MENTSKQERTARRGFQRRMGMEELEERERTIVILKYFEEWKIDDIADLLKENPNTVKSILYRSLKKLKIKMSREEIA